MVLEAPPPFLSFSISNVMGEGLFWILSVLKEIKRAQQWLCTVGLLLRGSTMCVAVVHEA
jgi:hypothetical protein